MLEDRLDLQAQLFLRKRDQPGRFVDGPLLPGATVEPGLGLLLHLGQGPVDGFLAHTVRAVRIREIARDEDVGGLDLVDEVANDLDVRRTYGILLDLSRLVERQIEETSG